MKTKAAPREGAFFIKRINFWVTVTFVAVFLVGVPVGVIYSSLLKDSGDVWPHLFNYVLPHVFGNTLLLMLGVGIGTLLLGVSLAWLVTFYDFPGRRYFDWLLFLPLAMPTYVLGFVWIGMLDYSSPFATLLRNWDIHLPQVRSLGGVVFVMSLALYPYVYLLARNAFLSTSESVLNAAASLGMKPRQIFLKVVIPMARPWIIGGLSLVMMETLADFGTVSTFNYDTFTTAIYKTWFGFFSLTGASQLASFLITFVFLLIIIEMFLRRNRGYASGAGNISEKRRVKLRGIKAYFASTFPLWVLALGFLLPLGQLIYWGVGSASSELDTRYFGLLWHTVLLGFLSALIIGALAMCVGYTQQRYTHWSIKVLTKIGTIGYALPGTVLAVGIFASLIWFDEKIGTAVGFFFKTNDFRILTGTIFAMLLAYTVRYLAVGYQPIETAMQRITTNIDEAARNFGYRGIERLSKIYFPIIRKGVLTALILVWVDVMKEMPITLMTRPFGWDTFAVRIFEMTSEGEWERAALPAVFLVLAGMIPVLFLMNQREQN